MTFIRFFLIILVSFSSVINAMQSDITINKHDDIFKDFSLTSYEDTSAELSFNEILEIKKFKPQHNRISKGYSKSSFWFKFNITNATSSKLSYFIKFTESYIHELDFYIVSSSGESINYQQGVGYFSENSLNHLKQPQFQIDLNSGEYKTVYFRIFGLYPVFTAVYVFNKESLNEYIQKHDVLYALFFGSIAAMILSNLCIFFYGREMAYLYYVLYGSVFLCWQLQVNSFPPFNTFNSATSFYFFGILVPIGIVFFLFFVNLSKNLSLEIPAFFSSNLHPKIRKE